MSTPPWEFQYSVEIEAGVEFAWAFWTNVSNWRKLEPGVDFELDGPFAPGTRGLTRMPAQPPQPWLIRAVDPGRSWSQEISLPATALMIEMRFEELATCRTRITQRLWLEGEGAAAFLEGVRLFETTTPDGMKRIAAIIEQARRESDDATGAETKGI